MPSVKGPANAGIAQIEKIITIESSIDKNFFMISPPSVIWDILLFVLMKSSDYMKSLRIRKAHELRINYLIFCGFME